MENTNQYLKVITKGAGIILAGIFLSKLFTFFYRILVARLLGPAEYGDLNIAIAIIGFVTIIALAGFQHGIIRFVSFYEGKKDFKGVNAIIKNSFIVTMILGIILSIMLFLFTDKIAMGIFKNPGLIPLINILVLSIPVGVILNNLEMVTLALRAVKYITISRHIIETLSKVILTAILLFIGFGLKGAAIAYLLSMIISAAVLFYFLQKKVYPITQAISAKSRHMMELVKFSMPMLFYEFTLLAVMQIDTLILGYFQPSNIVGIYNAVTPTARMVYTIPAALTLIFYPTICGIYAKKEPISDVYKSVTKWIIFVTLPFTIALCFYSREILSILFGGEYVSGYIALIIISLSLLAYSFSSTSQNILAMLKRTDLIFINKLVAVVANILLNIYLIPRYGINGAAVAFAVSFFMEGLLIWCEAYYLTKIFPFKWSYINAFIASAASIGAYYLMKPLAVWGIYGFICSVLAFGAVYALLLLVMPGSIEESDKEIFRAAIGKIKRMMHIGHNSDMTQPL